MTTDTITGSQPAPWFRWASYASLAWMLLGVASYLYNVSVDPATLPADQKAINDAVPDWMVAFFAIAVWVGLAGAVMLVMRRKGAEALLIGSLVACLMQFSAYFVHRPLREVMPANGLVLPVIIVVATAAVYWVARTGRQRGWLR